MNKKEVISNLKHALHMYAIQKDEDELTAILVYSAMLVGMEE